MKKAIKIFLLITLVISMFTGCSIANKEQKDNVKVNSQFEKFKEENGLLTYTDTSNSPFENSGLKITIKKANEGYAKFVKTDKEGKETVDYYNFNYEKNQVEKYYYVSAMGTGFYYYYDLDSGTLVKIEDKDHKDSTQSTKDSNRWENAVSKMDQEVKSLEEYFSAQFNISIRDAVIK